MCNELVEKIVAMYSIYRMVRLFYLDGVCMWRTRTCSIFGMQLDRVGKGRDA